ncbi:6,7-dimethyl-8-ribityllumazine synthase [Arsenicitalea aurantiaca]|uniref:6,7-dimethyl-8-ribityllumazine synthase n=1 Tax=Arsenicitalea aurantiaca TaxID=1783274 RepID=A0A433XEM9_9HYPH|nr:6,7-dimethyl-8-ribityllumazine synthase [Arsenicitalea aurantiaca]RUT32543.1 6,7-dimethyl-8-ribityllumazine synthase [Arsenicitalea aurantiaca]
MADAPHILVIEARFYDALADALYGGAEAALAAAGATHDRVTVPGVLEIPAALAMAIAAGEQGGRRYDGFVTLGCVIRGETTHYDIVSNESARAIMDLSVAYRLALGNGIQTVENEAQAWARCSADKKDKGGGAARAALAMIALRNALGA